MWIPRAVEPRLKRSAKTRPVIVLTGARQTGKTSPSSICSPDTPLSPWIYPPKPSKPRRNPHFSATSSPARHHRRGAICPRPLPALKAEVDARRTRNGQFLLTGSQKFTLMKNVSESLAGRADIVELETLSSLRFGSRYRIPGLKQP